ncbi:MAG: DNA-binding IclR family transcriptional regulator [Parasphingorhabdus sp.]|jgi:DNA-binding IclR family transcriptional regulator|uniref:DUF3489 domain-containing protein n=1 Tax=Parasphingorhabdus sp. TaxID=2709688 RepID=UPI0039E37ADC
MATTKIKPQTKSDKVIALLGRAKGASLDEICEASNWQPHSARTFMTGLRKKGFVLAREQRGDGGTAYRITSFPAAEDASA